MIETNKNFAKLNSITKENLELKKELEYYKAKTADIKEFENINEELKRTYNELAKNNSITKENFELKKEIEYYKLKTVDIKEVENMNEELKRTYNELEKNKNKVGILENECDQLYKELNNTQLKYWGYNYKQTKIKLIIFIVNFYLFFYFLLQNIRKKVIIRCHQFSYLVNFFNNPLVCLNLADFDIISLYSSDSL